jgi:hypothetical protein
VKEKASIYVPAIGKVTIVVLLRNLMVILPHGGSGSKKKRRELTCMTHRQRLLENRQQRESL